jgi:hypothetical protein
MPIILFETRKLPTMSEDSWIGRQPVDAKGEPLTGLLIEPLLDGPCRALCIIDRTPRVPDGKLSEVS